MRDTPNRLARVLQAALPIMLGYVAIGLPCGIMESTIGLSPLTCFLVSSTFYSGAGQFMVPNLLLAGASIASVAASVSFVNTRQVLYSAALAPYARTSGPVQAFLFAATVTDESFGVNMHHFEADETWAVADALGVNLLSMFTWAAANAAGCAVGSALEVPLALTSYAMTSIFICLLAQQGADRRTLTVMGVAALGVCVCKLVGLGGPAVFLGALTGVVAGVCMRKETGDGVA